MRVGEGGRGAGGAANMALRAEIGEDALLHRDRKADGPQLLLRNIGCCGVSLARQERRAAAHGEGGGGDAVPLSAEPSRFRRDIE